ncbi:hypothetical protein L204_102553 [Cryptococcus depauperatus]
MDPYTPEYDRPPYVEEVIQPGYDTEYDTGPGYEYTEAYPPPQYALEDELGDINIQDDWIDPQDDFDQEYIEESWIPYSSPIPPKYSSATPASQNGNQQVVIAPPTNWYPPPSDLRQHYCELYPGDCLQNRTPLETNATERSNTTLGEDLTSRTNLKHIDLPGVGLALVLLLFILFGLNAGWSSGGNDKKDRRSSTANPSETGSGSGSGGKGNETGSGGRSSGTGSGGKGNETGSGSGGKETESGSRGRSSGTGSGGKANETGSGGKGNETGSGGRSSGSGSGGKGNETGSGGKGNETGSGGRSSGTGSGGRSSGAGSGGKGNETRSGGKGNETGSGGRSSGTGSGGKGKETESGSGGRSSGSGSGGKGNETGSGGRSSGTGSGGKGNETGSRGKGNETGSGGRSSGSGSGGKGNETGSGGRSSGTGSGGKGKETESGSGGRSSGSGSGGKGNETGSGGRSSGTGSGGKGNETGSGGKGNETGSGGKGNETGSGGRSSGTGSGGKGKETESGSGGRSSGSGSGGKGNETGSGGRSSGTGSGGKGNETGSGGKGNETGSGGKGNETGSGGRSSGTGSGGRSSGTGSGGRSGGSGGRGDGRPPSEKDKKNDGESKSWLSPPILLGLLLLIPLLAMAGRSSLPQIGSHSMPTLKRPSIFTGGLEGMRGPGGLGAILTDPVTDAAPRAAISPRARAAVGSKWVVNSKPEPKAHIHINNVNSQGDGNPINIGSSTNERPVEITVEEPVEEKVWEPVTFNFTGPSNPDRLLKMILAALVVALPLVIDWVTDYPKRQYSQPEYLEPMVQFLVLGALFLICLLVADWHFGLSSAVYTIAPYAEVSLTEARSGLTPLIVGAVETGESLLWSVEDVVFGDSRVLLGMGLAALGVVLASQKEPSLEVPKTDYASGATQAIYFFGALLIGMFVWST